MKDIVSLERMLEKLYEWVITRGVNMFFGVIKKKKYEKKIQ